MFRLKPARNDPINLLDENTYIQSWYKDYIIEIFFVLIEHNKSILVNLRFFDSPATKWDVSRKIFTIQIKWVCLGNAKITWHHEEDTI